MHHDRTGSRLDDPISWSTAAALAPMSMTKPSVELEHADGVGVGVADVLVADSMLARAGRDDRLSAHVDKLACEESDDKRRALRTVGRRPFLRRLILDSRCERQRQGRQAIGADRLTNDRL